MSTAIVVSHVGKEYRLGSINASTLHGDLSRWWSRLRGRPDPSDAVIGSSGSRARRPTFQALQDVSFDVQEGEVFGIVGRNGAGKSTLLKILSQVTAPTSGRIEITGRVASLLEVGTGFHPDLTGRENVFMNGAIMGMTAADIRAKFDDIVAFSECEMFIDTPVKRYSSGMYVRLAFAVAAHLEPDILIVDEVLAVGDAEFQKKCLGKMGDASKGGRTVLFVSHNMAAVKRLCTKAVLLNRGKVERIGTPGEVIDAYLGAGRTPDSHWMRETPVPATSGIFLREIWLAGAAGSPASTFDTTEDIAINIVVEVPVQTRPAAVTLRLTNSDGIAVLTTANSDVSDRLIPLPRGSHRFEVRVPAGLLAGGSYSMLVAAHIPHEVLFDSVENLTFTVENIDTAVRDERIGVVNPKLDWRSSIIEGTLDSRFHPASLSPR